jgi:hypothetical protein
MEPMMNHILHFSGGITSYAAGQRLRNAGVDFRMVFADTIIEDNDTYRFLVEGAAQLSGIPKAEVCFVSALALSLPELEGGTADFRARRLLERKVALSELRSRTALMIPALTWLCDGRTPFEVFHDERYLGNSRVDPCSKILKRELLDRWVGDRRADESRIHYFGLDWTEPKRVERFRLAMAPQHVKFPMAESPFVTKFELIESVRVSGIDPPRLYYYGFPHGNCGGGCIKFGQKQAAILLKARPKYFDWWADEEEDMRKFLGKDVAILRDRRGGQGRPLPLRVLQKRIEDGHDWDQTNVGACNCFEVEQENPYDPAAFESSSQEVSSG